MTLVNCQHIVLDAGHIAVSSELVDKAVLGEVKAKENQQYAEQDYQRLESLMYDKFHVKLESAQVSSSPPVSPVPIADDTPS
jgi:vacuolar protein sorting-associated protein 13A/C